MKATSLIIVFIIGISSLKGQLYCPPVRSSNWDTIAPNSLGWAFTGNDHVLTLKELKPGLYNLFLRNNTISQVFKIVKK